MKNREELILNDISNLVEEGIEYGDIFSTIKDKYKLSYKEIDRKIKKVISTKYNECKFGKELTEKIFNIVKKGHFDLDGDIVIVDGKKYFVNYFRSVIREID